jgi:PAS domain S-box-containing protein
MNPRLLLEIQKHLHPRDLLYNHPLLQSISDICDAYEQQLVENSQNTAVAKQKTDELHHMYGSDITERKETTDEIRESEERYRKVAENPILGIVWGTAGGIIQDANGTICTMLGYTREELVNMHFTSFTHPDDFGKELTLIRQMMNNEIDNYTIEKRFLTKKKEIIWVDLNVMGVHDTAGKIKFMIAVVQNITSRKMIEESLQKSEQNLRNILENTDTAYVLVDINARILSYNNLAMVLMHDTMNDTLAEGKNYIDLMYDNRRENVHKSFDYVLKNKVQVSYEIKYPVSNRPDKWLQVNIHPIINASHELLGLSISATNITARKNIEQEIKQINERYDMVLQATNDVIWDWDLEKDRIHLSDNYTNIYGHPSVENETLKSWFDNIHPEDKEQVLANMNQVINDPDARLWKDAYRFYRKSGELAYVQNRGYIIQNEKSKAMRMVGAMWDVTPEKLYEIERDKITSDLIQRNKDLEQFTYIVSHNLRSPVANIIGLSNILNDPEFILDKVTETDLLSGLSVSANKLDEVIKDLNNILQTNQHINEEKEPLQFSGIVDAIEFQLKDMMEVAQVEIRTNFAEAAEIVSLKSYMHSIFYNLIMNAMKYKQPDTLAIIEVTSSRPSDHTLELRFKDNGLGIDLQKQGHNIFGLYKRFHSHIEGKGMGLFMVKTQVERMGGSISVQSEVNKGTEFSILFDLA